MDKLDQQCALIVIDIQQGILALPIVMSEDDLVSKVSTLMDCFHQHHRPVVMVNVAGAPAVKTDAGAGKIDMTGAWSKLDSRLPLRDDDIFVTKKSWGAFSQTQLDETLQSHGITQIVLAGVSTSIGVETTARQAFELGYNVVFIEDAMTDVSTINHQHSMERIFPRLGQRTSTDEIITMFDS